MSLERFVSLWMHTDHPPGPVTEAALQDVETRFGFALPGDYRSAVLRVGLVAPTIDLLDTIVDRDLDMADLSELFAPAEMIDSTEAWRGMGLRSDLVAFASDSAGNLFCFGTGEPGQVIYFDHDFGTARVEAPSFDDWIERFCDLATGVR